jgi:hypothetical protein
MDGRIIDRTTAPVPSPTIVGKSNGCVQQGSGSNVATTALDEDLTTSQQEELDISMIRRMVEKSMAVEEARRKSDDEGKDSAEEADEVREIKRFNVEVAAGA